LTVLAVINHMRPCPFNDERACTKVTQGQAMQFIVNPYPSN